MDTSIFKTYDIRGIYRENIDTDTACRVARAFRRIIKKGIVVIAYDARTSSPYLFHALKNELKKNEKYKVWSVGMATTPMFYFAVNDYRAAGGIMVTASHNPKEWNGFKLVGKKACMIGGREVGAMITRDCKKKEGEKKKILSVSEKKILPRYIRFLQSRAKIRKPIRVVFDCGNGVAGIVLKELAPRLKNVDTHFLFARPNGKFPGRGPNPLSVGALTPLIKEVKRKNADIGMAFDADADRIFLIDKKGRIIPSYVVLALLSSFLKGSCVGEVLMYYMLRSVGFTKKLYKTKVGTYFVKEKMRKEGAVVAGEYSGHFYFKDFFFTDSGILAAVNILSALSERAESIGEFYDSLPTLFTRLINVQSKNGEDEIKNIAEKLGIRAKKVDSTDGKTLIFETSWMNIRAANTEPLLRFFIAATTKKELDALTRTVKSRTL